MPKDPSFDSYLDQQIEEHMRDELLEQFPDEQHDEYCSKEGCAQCEEEEEEDEETSHLPKDPEIKASYLVILEEHLNDKPWGQG